MTQVLAKTVPRHRSRRGGGYRVGSDRRRLRIAAPARTPSSGTRRSTRWTRRFLRAQAFAVKNGRFIAVGAQTTTSGISRPPGPKSIDASGMTVTPGFIDAHSHPFVGRSLGAGPRELRPSQRRGDPGGRSRSGWPRRLRESGSSASSTTTPSSARDGR